MTNLVPEYTRRDLMSMSLDKLIELAERLGKLEELSDISVTQERNNFLELKSKFFHEVCGVPYSEKPNRLSYKERIAQAVKERADGKEDAIGKKLGFKK